MWRRVDLVWTDVSEEHIVSIFRVEKFSSNTLLRNVSSQDPHGATSQKTALYNKLCFGGIYDLHFQDWLMSQVRNQDEAGSFT
jgi:hypothetical protein